ncbi:globin [Sphingobium aquiterrae]|uniref:globin domain-containing protein n=1 Tax=Sphingobium aquiterrae TaxID=2038656 RepID=UPI00301912CF
MNATTALTPYDAIGGEAAVVAIVSRFYDIMDRDPAYARLRTLHAADLAPVRNGLARFIAGWLGGPRDWFDRGQCVMSIHRAFHIDTVLAAQWSEAMSRAIAGQDGITSELQAKLVDALGHMARAMVSPLTD